MRSVKSGGLARPVIDIKSDCKSDCLVDATLAASVVVPTRDRNRQLERCLEAISRAIPSPIEVIVVDSAPLGEGAEAVARRWSARYVREVFPGASRARNTGARIARGEIVAFTDDDAIPGSNWLVSILQEFLDPTIGMVAGKVVSPLGDFECNYLHQLCGFSGQGDLRIVLGHDTPGWFESITFLPFGLGPNLAIRREILQRWGGFDERLGPGTAISGHEEQRAFLQLIDLGYRLVYTPKAIVSHPSEMLSVLQLRSRSLRRMQASSAYLTLLMVEEARFRKKLLQCIFRKLWRTIRATGGDYTKQLSGPRRLLARLQGPGLYLRSRWVHRVKRNSQSCSPVSPLST